MPLKLHRIAHALWALGIPVIPQLIRLINRIVFGVVLPPSARIGKNVMLSYQGLGTVIHDRAVIGDRCIIGTCVTIGGRSGHEAVPVIEDGVMIGSGAKVLGPVRVGKCASIGANAVVLTDIPDYAVAVGVPAKIVKYLAPDEVPDYFAVRSV